jgi:hypothetical protein
MIRTEAEYQEARRRPQQDNEGVARQQATLIEQGLPAEQVARGMTPLLSFHALLEEEIARYEQVSQGERSRRVAGRAQRLSQDHQRPCPENPGHAPRLFNHPS